MSSCRLFRHGSSHSCRLVICLVGIAIVVFMICPTCNLGNVYGMSPFSRDWYDDTMYDEYDENDVDNPNAEGYSTVIDNLPLNISSVTFLSDGNYLNATVWLSDPILADRHREYVNSSINYVMEIYQVLVHEDRDIGDLLYSVVIYPEGDGSWTKRIIEYEPGTAFSEEGIKVDDIELDYMDVASRTLKTYHNVTGFFQDNNTYVDISLPLDDIGNPDDINIALTSYAKNGKNPIYDTTHYLDAPSRLTLHLFNWPRSLEVRAGEVATGTFLIQTLEAAGPGNYTLQQSAKADNYTLEFTPDRIEFPLNGTVTSNFGIKIEPHVKDKVLPVDVNVTLAFKGETIGDTWNERFYVTVLPPLSELDKEGRSFSEFLVGTFALYWIPFGISSIFGYWLSRRIDRGRLPKEFLEQLRTKDILAVNASVVAGVLIFLTVGGTELFGAGALVNISILTASIVYPFAISAILILITGDPIYGIKFTIPGFVFLMVSIVLIAFLLGNPNLQNT
jgi:hypothetical protein